MYKRSSPRPLPNSGRASTTLPASEGLVTDTSPSTLKSQTRAGFRHPNQPAASVSSRTLVYTNPRYPTKVATGLVSTHHDSRLHTRVTGADHPGTLPAHSTSASDSEPGHPCKEHFCTSQGTPASDPALWKPQPMPILVSATLPGHPTQSTLELPPMLALAPVTWPGHPLHRAPQDTSACAISASTNLPGYLLHGKPRDLLACTLPQLQLSCQSTYRVKYLRHPSFHPLQLHLSC